jgi:hypothetical protein
MLYLFGAGKRHQTTVSAFVLTALQQVTLFKKQDVDRHSKIWQNWRTHGKTGSKIQIIKNQWIYEAPSIQRPPCFGPPHGRESAEWWQWSRALAAEGWPK